MISVVIPSYKTGLFIVDTVKSALNYADHVIVVDDKCPENSGKLVQTEFSKDSRVTVIFRDSNGGVGAATKTGFKAASENGAWVILKIDGDGQMDASLIPEFVKHIKIQGSDYVKGNRFFSPEALEEMPLLRILGNAGLSLLSKISSGYWTLNDPTNGYVAIKSAVVRDLVWEKIDDRFFFESDLLFRLRVRNCKVTEVAMKARYGAEKSNLSPLKSVFRFSLLHSRNFIKRIVYQYYVREWNVGSILLPLSVIFMLFGFVFGFIAWNSSHASGVAATAGTVLISALPIILGVQLWVSFIAQDMASEPREPQF